MCDGCDKQSNDLEQVRDWPTVAATTAAIVVAVLIVAVMIGDVEIRWGLR